MQNFVRTKSLRNGEITLSFSLLIKLMHKSRFFCVPNILLMQFVKIKFSRKFLGYSFKSPAFARNIAKTEKNVLCNLIHVVALSRENQPLCVSKQ